MSSLLPNKPRRDASPPRRAAAVLAALNESTGDLIWSVDLHYRLLTFSRVFQENIARNFGVRAAVGMTPADLLPPEKASSWPPLYERALSDGPFRAECPLLDGRIVEMAFNPIALDGQRIGVAVSGKDVTAQRALEKALQEAEKNYRDVFEDSPEGIFRCSPQGRILAVNSALAKLLGYDSAEELASTVTDFGQQAWLAPNERSRPAAPLEELGIVQGQERSWIRKDGSVVFVRESARAVRDETGAVRFYQGIVEDITERKIAEKKLVDSEEKFRATFMNRPDALYLATLEDGRIIDINESFEKLFGYSRQEVVGRTSLELNLYFDPGDRARVVAELKAKGRIMDFETKGVRKDGAVFAASLSIVTLTLEGERHISGAVRDITGRKQSQEALALSEARYRSLIESQTDVISRSDLSGKLTFVNDAYCRVFGRSQAELIGRHFGPTVHPRDLPISLQALKTVQLPPYRSQTETRNLTTQGVRWFSWDNSAVLDQAGNVVELQGVGRDITDRKLAEDALLESEKKYRALYESSSDAVLLTAPGGKILAANAEACRIFERTEAEICRLGRAGLVDLSDSRLPALLEERERTGKARGELTCLRPDGTPFPAEVSSAAFTDRDGTLLNSLIVRDITERKRLEEQLRQAQKMESIGRLAGGVAHDFNNLLNVILGYNDLALRALKAGDPILKYVTEVEKAAERAADLTRQLLTFSRRQVIEPKSFNFNDLVREIEKMLQRLLGEDIKLITRLAPSLGDVFGDPGQFHNVLMNLAVNSRDAMPGGGVLTIETANVNTGPSGIRAYPRMPPGAYVLLRVMDTGSGMDAEARKHIFEPFFTTKEVGKGTGLGLSTVYGIVKQSEGWIWVESEAGKGTSFEIYLPRTEAEIPPSESAAAVVEELSGTETVLVVEDQAALRDLVAMILRGHGYRILEAEDGSHALHVAERHSGTIHLLLTDVVMPGGTGKELAERIQQSHPETKVIFMSGYFADAISERGMLEPGVHFIQKPFTPDALAAKVRQVLVTGQL